MSSPKKIVLSDYKAVFLDYEDEFRQSKGAARQGVMDKIVQEITAGGKWKKKGTMKGLEQVSLLFY